MSKPELRLGNHLAPGVIAVGLFGVMAWVFANAPLGEPAGFEGGSVMRTIGYALLNIDGAEGMLPVEGFIVAFFVIAFVLDAALDGAIMLARRDEEDESEGLMSSVRTDGGDDER